MLVVPGAQLVLHYVSLRLAEVIEHDQEDNRHGKIDERPR